MNRSIIDNFLRYYKPEARFIKSFELKENKGFALFNINCGFYCDPSQNLQYLSAVEFQLCLNQLMFVYFATLGLIPVDQEFDSRNYLITAQNMQFKKFSNTSIPINGEICIVDSKRIKNKTFLICSFKLGEGCSGSVTAILKS